MHWTTWPRFLGRRVGKKNVHLRNKVKTLPNRETVTEEKASSQVLRHTAAKAQTLSTIQRDWVSIMIDTCQFTFITIPLIAGPHDNSGRRAKVSSSSTWSVTLWNKVAPKLLTPLSAPCWKHLSQALSSGSDIWWQTFGLTTLNTLWKLAPCRGLTEVSHLSAEH